VEEDAEGLRYQWKKKKNCHLLADWAGTLSVGGEAVPVNLSVGGSQTSCGGERILHEITCGTEGAVDLNKNGNINRTDPTSKGKKKTVPHG